MYAFPCSPLDYRVLATNLLPLIDPGQKPTIQNSSLHENGWGLECQKVNFLEYLELARELLDAVHFPTCSSGTSVAPQTFTLTPAT